MNVYRTLGAFINIYYARGPFWTHVQLVCNRLDKIHIRSWSFEVILSPSLFRTTDVYVIMGFPGKSVFLMENNDHGIHFIHGVS